jgi:hypothetical protein
MLSVHDLFIVMLNVVMLSVVMLSVVGPNLYSFTKCLVRFKSVTFRRVAVDMLLLP